MNVLVTGGAGYIGSHTCVELLEAGHTPIVVDNLCNSSEVSLQRVREITGKEVVFIRGDVRDEALLDQVMEQYRPACAIHFAGLKAVGESVVELLRPIREYMDRYCFDRYAKHRTEVRIAQLGNDAGVIGAALIGLQAK